MTNSFILITLLATFASAFGTTIGFGGGIFVIPILVVFFGIKMQFAVGTVALALFPAALISTIFNSKNKQIDYLTAVLLEVPTICGAIIGAYLTTKLSIIKLEFVFAFFLIYFALKSIIFGKKIDTNRKSLAQKINSIGPKFKRHIDGKDYEVGLIASLFFGTSSGIVAGLFGIGGGFIKTPIMMKVFKLPPKVAVGTALLMIVFTSATSSFSHAKLGHLQTDLAVPLIIGFISGSLVGNMIKKKVSQNVVEKMMSYGLLLAGITVLTHAVTFLLNNR